MCVYLLLYEYVVDPTETKIPGTPKAGSVKNNRNRTLLIGGRKDGSICVFNWHTGEITFTVSVGYFTKHRYKLGLIVSFFFLNNLKF